MQTKYDSASGFWWARAYRGALRTLLRPLVRWRPAKLEEDACTLVLGCHTDLVDMLPGNLGCLARQRLDRVREILLVFDSAGPHLRDVQRHVAERFPELHCRVIVYSPL